LRLTPEDRELLDQLAEEYGSRSAVLREGMALLVKRKG
jgi:Arc/MetJ-type ribon-helix-helix transcriptional regulator